MALAAFSGAVEASRHEVAAAALVMKTTFSHVDPRGSCHEIIRVLDFAVALRICKLFIAIICNAVELHEPVLEAFPRIDLT